MCPLIRVAIDQTHGVPPSALRRAHDEACSSEARNLVLLAHALGSSILSQTALGENVRLLILVAALAVSSPVAAKEAEWWMIGTGANQEGRTVMFADAATVTGTDLKPRVWVELIYGPPQAAKVKKETIFYEIDCKAGTGTRLSTYRTLANGSTSSDQPSVPEPLFIPPNSTGSFAHNFVCDRENSGAVRIHIQPDAFAAEIREAYLSK